MGHRDIQRLVAVDKSFAEIAGDLGIVTMEAHHRNIKRKLKIISTMDLTRYTIREALT